MVKFYTILFATISFSGLLKIFYVWVIYITKLELIFLFLF